MKRFLLAGLLAVGFIGHAAAQSFPGFGPVNSFYIGNGNGAPPSWYLPAAARNALGLATWTVTGSIVPLANGGLGAALTPSNGGILYSTDTGVGVLAGTVTAAQCLLSGATAPPTWGSCSGAAAVSAVANSDGTLTISPTTGSVTASLNLGNANTWTAAQTFTNSDLLLLGSSTGATTFASSNTGASNYTITIPAATDTLVLRGTTQTFSGANTFSALVNFTSTFEVGGFAVTWPGAATIVAALNIKDQLVTGGANVTAYSIGTITTGGSTTIDCGNGQQQYLTNNSGAGGMTIVAPATDGACNIKIINGATPGTVTFSGFTVNASYVGAPLDTTPAHLFLVAINRDNETSVYFVVPHQ